jgi:hypothetical protein
MADVYDPSQDGSLLFLTPIDPLFLVIPLLVSLLSRPGKSANDVAREQPFSATLSLETAGGSRTDRFLPLDDLILEASRTDGYRLPEPFAQPRKEPEPDDAVRGEEWMGSRDVVELCRLGCMRTRLADACETNGEPLPPSAGCGPKRVL